MMACRCHGHMEWIVQAHFDCEECHTPILVYDLHELVIGHVCLGALEAVSHSRLGPVHTYSGMYLSTSPVLKFPFSLRKL